MMEFQRRKQIAKISHALEKTIEELKKAQMDDKEFTIIAGQVNDLVQQLYNSRSDKSPAAKEAFSHAMNTLRQIRSIYHTN